MSKEPFAGVSKHGRPLWAPWRIEYILSCKDGACFFCEKAGGEDVTNYIIARDSLCFALLNTYPYNSGHVLVAPYRHAPDLSALESDELAQMMSLIVRVKNVMRKVMAPEGFNIGFNIGEAAGAGVLDHVHGHVVPRWVGDTNFMPVVGDVRVVPQALADTAALLREAWGE